MDETLDLTPAMAMPPSILRTTVAVPEGFVMPCGEAIIDGFTLVVEAGARWHPDWEGPQITVNAWRFMTGGSAMGWAGDDILAFESLMPAKVVAMAKHHGLRADAELMEAVSLSVPAAPQAMVTFLVSNPHKVN